jgi:hypothetical protein
MGTIYYVACEACHEYADLDKFYACCQADHDQAADDHIAYVAERIRDRHLVRAAVLVAFVGSHMGHEVRVYTEHDDLHDRILDENCAAETAGTKRPWTMTMEFGTESLCAAVKRELGRESD